jgi:hypothetical protein
VRQFIADYPQYWSEAMAADSRGQPDIFYQLSDKAHFADFITAEALMHSVMNWYFGPAQAGRLFMRASFEILHRYPKLAMLIYENFLNFTVITSVLLRHRSTAWPLMTFRRTPAPISHQEHKPPQALHRL